MSEPPDELIGVSVTEIPVFVHDAFSRMNHTFETVKLLTTAGGYSLPNLFGNQPIQVIDYVYYDIAFMGLNAGKPRENPKCFIVVMQCSDLG